METERVRGNPSGITNAHAAQNIRAARQAIGMDLRTMSTNLTDAGRKISPSGISKIENGDRRVDVDDLTGIAYILRTTPAALLTPPDNGTTLAGVPEHFLPEEIQAWLAGRVKLTDDDLIRYWKEEAFNSASYVRRSEEILAQYDQGHVGVTPREVYEKRVAAHCERLGMIRGRQLALDPMAVTIED